MLRATLLLLSSCFVVTACATAGDDPPGDPPGDPVDASADTPDAPIGPTVDASPGTPDAPVTPGPDAMMTDASPTCSTQQLLQNGGFDSGSSPWIVDQGGLAPVITPFPPGGVTPHSSPNVAALGSIPFTTDKVSQEIIVPAGAQDLQLLGQHWITTEETGGSANDDLVITIQDASGIDLLTLGTRSNVDASANWTSFVMTSPLTFAGQTIILHIEGDNGLSNLTTFSLDSLSVLATVCN